MDMNIETLISHPTTAAMALRIAGRSKSQGRCVTGLVVADKDGSRCIVENGVAIWFTAEEWAALVQPNERHKERQHRGAA